MRRVLIIGASSLVGTHLALRLREKHSVVGTFYRHRPLIGGISLIRFALRNDTPWEALLRRLKPDAVFYCAAERDEKKCQEQPLNALAVNAEIPAALARVMETTGGRLIYFSTSKVFSGEEGDYDENDETDAITHYGKSKARGEELLAPFSNTFILRLGTLYGLGPVPSRSLLHRLLSDVWSDQQVSLIENEYRSFQPAQFIGEVGQRILAADDTEAGLYQVPSPDKESHYSFCVKLAKALGVSAAHLVPVSGETFGGEPRGRDTSLRGSLFQNTFGMRPLPTAKYLETLGENLRTGTF